MTVVPPEPGTPRTMTVEPTNTKLAAFLRDVADVAEDADAAVNADCLTWGKTITPDRMWLRIAADRLAALDAGNGGADTEAIARVVVRENLKRLHSVDFGGLVACGVNRAKASELVFSLLFPESP